MTKTDANNTHRPTTDGGLKYGDKVQVKRKPTHDETLSWNDAWVPTMNKFIGSVGKVDYISGRDTVGIRFTENNIDCEIYNFPECCVEAI